MAVTYKTTDVMVYISHVNNVPYQYLSIYIFVQEERPVDETEAY